jgi:hypothetical protein
MRHITATVDLDASPGRVWAVLTDVTGHGAWNPFITRMAGVLDVGQRIDIRITPPGGRSMTFHPVVTDVQHAHRLAWVGHLGFPGLFDGAHSFTLTPLPNGRTQLVQSETFSGVLVWMSRGLLTKTAAGFDAMHIALSKRVRERPLTPLPS